MKNPTADGGVKYSIVNLDTGKSYVQASRQVIHGNSVAEWRSQISEFFNRALKNGPIEIETIEGDILTISKNTAEKARSKTATENGVSRELTNKEFLVKLHAEAHIDELAEISHKNKRPPVPDGKKHSFAKDGFTYRTVYFQDFDGSYYRISLSVGDNNGISTVYNVGKIKVDDIPDGKIISTIGSKADMSSTKFSISSEGKNVKQNDDIYLDAVSHGNMETAQRMVDKAAKAAGYTIKAYHGTTNREEKRNWNSNTRSWDTEYRKITVFKRQYPEQAGHFFNSDMDNAGGYGYDLYSVYLMLKNPLVIDCRGQNYASITFDGKKMDTYEWATYAKKNRYDGVVFENISDGVGYADLQRLTTDYVVFDSNRIKSADPVTYDDKGNVIPLSERFNVLNRDVRYSLSDDETTSLDGDIPIRSDLPTQYGNYTVSGKDITLGDDTPIRDDLPAGGKSNNDTGLDDDVPIRDDIPSAGGTKGSQSVSDHIGLGDDTPIRDDIDAAGQRESVQERQRDAEQDREPSPVLLFSSI